MFEIEGHKVPIKVWLPGADRVEDSCLQQAYDLANLQNVFHHVALMPDTHAGYGMPIGGVLATKGVIIPNAVGSDIGCGMCFISTNIPASLLRTTETPMGLLGHAMIGVIMRNVPTGFKWHDKPQVSEVLDKFIQDNFDLYVDGSPLFPSDLWELVENGYYQVGTLGGGNHFIELQEDEEGMLCIMLHSGSRNFGKRVCDYYNAKAKLHQREDENSELLALDINSDDGMGYTSWMNLALDFARENRQVMIERVKSIVLNMIEKYTTFRGFVLGEQINAHHNYAVWENHYGEDVLVHRKGAIRAGKDEIGIIPGAMGSFSYIVKGLGNPESFLSASHGAGRCMGRRQALKTYPVDKVINDLKSKGVFLGMEDKSGVAEECIWAYKDVDFVIENESDLVVPVKKLKTVCVVKGSGDTRRKKSAMVETE